MGRVARVDPDQLAALRRPGLRSGSSLSSTPYGFRRAVWTNPSACGQVPFTDTSAAALRCGRRFVGGSAMTWSRRIWPLAMVLPLMVMLGGCNRNPAPAARAVRAGLQVGKGTQHFVPAGAGISQRARPLSEAASDLAAAPTPTPGRAAPQVRKGLVAISTADEAVEQQYRKLLADALCLGMDQLAQLDEETRFEQEGWKTYLLAYFDQVGPNVITDYARGYAEEKIEEFVTAMNFAEISPSVARVYVQECVSASP
jgi:hypothetical protein